MKKAINKVKQLVSEKGCISEVAILKAYGEQGNPLITSENKLVTLMVKEKNKCFYFNLLFNEVQFNELFDLIIDLDLMFCFDILNKNPLNEVDGQIFFKRYYKKEKGFYSLVCPYDTVINNCVLLTKAYFEKLSNKKKNELIKFKLYDKETVQLIKKSGDSHE